MRNKVDTLKAIQRDTAALRQLLVAAMPESEEWLDQLTTQLDHEGKEVVAARMGMALTAMLDLGVGAPAALAVLAQTLPDEKLTWLYNVMPLTRPIVQGIRSIINLNTSKANLQSENFMRFLLLLANDIQALLAVKAIKLYRIRQPEAQCKTYDQKLVSDLEHLYLPLAHRMGLYQVKSEMEDYVMRQKEAPIYAKISRALQESEVERRRYIESFIAPVKTLLDTHGIACDVKYRVKTIASIWRKMQVQRVDVEGVYDVFAIRIIYQGAEEEGKRKCWEIYSLITDLYRPDPSRLRDWVSVPRPSGYESLHTTVEGSGGRPVEVQIRTTRMDREAEEGPAAHWRYKEGRRKGSDAWLSRAREMLSKVVTGTSDSEIKEIVDDEIFTITPAGDLVRLRHGATVLDFAFEVHTDVGIRCKGGKVNGRIVPIRQQIRNGDTVEIMTGSKSNVSDDWLKIVVSSKARNRIRKALHERHAKDVIAGRELLERKLRTWKMGTLDDHITTLLHHFRIKEVAVLYQQIGTGRIALAQLRDGLEPPLKEAATGILTTEEAVSKPPRVPVTHDEEVLVINNEVETTAYQMAKCCQPVAGDQVFGFVTVGKGIRVHRNSCPNATDLKGRYPYRIISVQWAGKGDQSGLRIKLEMRGRDRLGIVNTITDVLSNDLQVMIRAAHFQSEGGKFQGEVEVVVKNRDHIGWMVRKLEHLNGVDRVAARPEGTY